MKKTLLIASVALFASACANTQTAKAPAAPSFKTSAEAIAAAEAATKKVAGVGYQWRDTGKIIEAAKKAEAEKDSATAMKMAIKALNQSKNAMAQYEAQKDAASRF